MKFTKSHHLGVVAAGNDIGFDIPASKDEYHVKVNKYNKYNNCYEQVWQHTSSGILVRSVCQEWDESFVLVFPLERSSKKCKYTRHEIEIAIGNYLEAMNVPIIDYYSHNI